MDENRQPLINPSGAPFTPEEIAEAERDLSNVPNDERAKYRNRNASAIALDGSPRLLIVAGPGTGKSFLFRDRIKEWLKNHPGRSIYVTSFVRKLVRDLEAEVATDRALSNEDKKRVVVRTLHGLARSLVERAGGTAEHPLGRHIRMISPYWKTPVWGDVLSFHTNLKGPHDLRELEDQMHNLQEPPTDEWRALRETYFTLSRFYNAIGFADSILLATDAVRENPEMIEGSLWIIDEFQDFNRAEDGLIKACIGQGQGALLAGDDDQALYQKLKASHPEIIRSYYEDADFVNAMLPYCGRCDYHICAAATAFIQSAREPNSILKVYLPVVHDPDATPVQVVACAAPSTAVDYIERFIEEHRQEIADRQAAIKEGTKKDPFLLILTPAKDLGFYKRGGQHDRLVALVREWQLMSDELGDDYFRVLAYYRHAVEPVDNFIFRKVLHYEQVPETEIHDILHQAIGNGCALSEVQHERVAAILEKCRGVSAVIEDDTIPPEDKVTQVVEHVAVLDAEKLTQDLLASPIGKSGVTRSEELEEEVETAGSIAAVDLLTIVGSKGLSAEHVIVVGFDNVYMQYVTPQAFFVAMTRARKSLHLITSLGAGGVTASSPYLDRIPERHAQHLKFTKKGLELLASRGDLVSYVKYLAKRQSGGAGSKAGGARSKRPRPKP